MAKIVKVKLGRAQNQGRILNGYPSEYDPTKIQIIAYEDLNDASKLYCIGVIADKDLVSFTASPFIEEITQLEAVTLGNVWRPQIKKITDTNKILTILDKVRNSQELTQSEKDAIDPDNATVGINKSATFTDMLNNTIGVTNNG